MKNETEKMMIRTKFPKSKNITSCNILRCCRCGVAGQIPTASRKPAETDVLPVFGARSGGRVGMVCRKCRIQRTGRLAGQT
jgi:hypothetical protein